MAVEVVFKVCKVLKEVLDHKVQLDHKEVPEDLGLVELVVEPVFKAIKVDKVLKALKEVPDHRVDEDHKVLRVLKEITV